MNKIFSLYLWLFFNSLFQYFSNKIYAFYFRNITTILNWYWQLNVPPPPQKNKLFSLNEASKVLQAKNLKEHYTWKWKISKKKNYMLASKYLLDLTFYSNNIIFFTQITLLKVNSVWVNYPGNRIISHLK